MEDTEFTVKLAGMVKDSDRWRKKWRWAGMFSLFISLFNFESSAFCYLKWYIEDNWGYGVMGVVLLFMGVWMAINCRTLYRRSEVCIRRVEVLQKLKDTLESTENYELREFAFDQVMASFNE